MGDGDSDGNGDGDGDGDGRVIHCFVVEGTSFCVCSFGCSVGGGNEMASIDSLTVSTHRLSWTYTYTVCVNVCMMCV